MERQIPFLLIASLQQVETKRQAKLEAVEAQKRAEERAEIATIRAREIINRYGITKSRQVPTGAGQGIVWE